jgi:hypothetical protein
MPRGLHSRIRKLPFKKLPNLVAPQMQDLRIKLHLPIRTLHRNIKLPATLMIIVKIKMSEKYIKILCIFITSMKFLVDPINSDQSDIPD